MRENPLLQNVVVTPTIREEVSWRAYMHFVNSGGRHGNDQAHWYQAETEILLEHMICANAGDHNAPQKTTSGPRPPHVTHPLSVTHA